MANVTGGIGDVRLSLLDVIEFQSQNGNYWVPIMGQSIAGSALAQITGMTTLPEGRGEFIRIADFGRGIDAQALTATFVQVTGVGTLASAPVAPYVMVVGQVVVFTTTGTLPAPLAISTPYYLIPRTTTTFKLATTFANAVAGTAIALTTAGTGTHTATLSRPVNSEQTEDFLSHSHSVYDPSHSHLFGYGTNYAPNNGNLTTQGSGGAVTNQTFGTSNSGTGISIYAAAGLGGGVETRPRNQGLHAYVRIN
jgi:hypothetical protein